MANVLRHPHFDRPPVANPNKRYRAGTINLRAVRRRRKMMEEYFAKEVHAPPMDIPTGRDWIQVAVDGNINAFRLFKGLRSVGLVLCGSRIVEDTAVEI